MTGEEYVDCNYIGPGVEIADRNEPCNTRRSFKDFVILLLKLLIFLIFAVYGILGGFGSMENTPTGHANDLPTFFGIFKNDPTSRSVNILFSGWILPQAVLKQIFTSQRSAQNMFRGRCFIV